MRSMWLAGLAVIAVAAVGPARANLLTFDPADACGGCAPGDPISQSYGDTPGVDVQYSSNMFFWDTGYDGLTNVAYPNDNTGGSGSAGEIFLKPTSGAAITLSGFDLGLYSDDTGDHGVDVTITDGIGNLLATAFNTSMANGSSFHYSSNLTSDNGFKIELGPVPFGDLAIDNISFGVPEPGSLALLITAVAGMGVLLRRRRSAV